jgi:hypothetical protein
MDPSASELKLPQADMLADDIYGNQKEWYSKDSVLALLTTHSAHLVERNATDAKELYEALEMMWEQYCPEPFTHKYMTAGENCEEMLQKHKKYSDQAIDIVKSKV